jgi:hypothetical protein
MLHFLFQPVCSAIPDLWFKLLAVLLIIMLVSSNTETGETLPGFRDVFFLNRAKPATNIVHKRTIHMMHMACLVIFLSCQLVEIVPTRS